MDTWASKDPQKTAPQVKIAPSYIYKKTTLVFFPNIVELQYKSKTNVLKTPHVIGNTHNGGHEPVLLDDNPQVKHNAVITT